MNDSLHEEKHREIDRLMVENDELIARFKANDIEIQNRIQALDKQLSAERKFRAEFGEWIESNCIDEDAPDDAYWVISPSVHTTFREVQDKFNELKAQHIDSASESEVEHNG